RKHESAGASDETTLVAERHAIAVAESPRDCSSRLLAVERDPAGTVSLDPCDEGIDVVIPAESAVVAGCDSLRQISQADPEVEDSVVRRGEELLSRDPGLVEVCPEHVSGAGVIAPACG